MKHPRQTVALIGSTLLACSLLIVGCATHRVNLLESGDVTIELAACKSICAVHIDAVQDGEDMIVSGKIRRSYTTAAVTPGYVDITLIGPDGKILREIIADYTPQITDRTRRTGLYQSGFNVRIPMIPPRGTVIRIEHKDY